VKIAFYRYLLTWIAVAIAVATVWLLYQKYITDPWTRDSQIRANIVGIAPGVAGPIINIPVHDNQEVKSGDLLFEIDPADYQTALASAKASVANLEANLRQKRQDLDRETDLFKRNVDSKQQFQNSQNAYAEAQAQLNAARANLQQAELNLGYAKVYAPVDGYLTNVNTSPGAYVHVGDQLLALVDSSSFWVAAYFKETQLVAIRHGRTVNHSKEERNKALVLEAFDTLFNRRDYLAAERYWLPNYIQHSAHIAPGREGLVQPDQKSPTNIEIRTGNSSGRR
jgi:multidrug resistance efflux pump